jgi:hypothetical protein
MKRSFFVQSMMVGVTALSMISCGATPRETAFFQRVTGALCDKFFATTTDEQRKNINFGFFFGASPAECKAVNDEQLGDQFARSLANRNFDPVAADACIVAIDKLSPDDVKKALAANLSASNFGNDQTLANNAKATLGYANYTCVTEQGACIAEAACNLSTPAGACFILKLAPSKDATVRTNEQTAAAAPTGAGFNCGSVFSFLN